MIKMTTKGETIKLKNYMRNIKSLFMICADFESILVPENNGNQNSDASYTNKYQNYVGCSFIYK